MDELSNIFLNPKILHLTKHTPTHTPFHFLLIMPKKEEDNNKSGRRNTTPDRVDLKKPKKKVQKLFRSSLLRTTFNHYITTIKNNLILSFIYQTKKKL